VKENWKGVLRMTRLYRKIIFPHDRPVPPTPFNEWVTRFPAPTQVKFKAAKETSTDVPRAYNLCKSFVKRELLLKDSEAGPLDFTPRLIQSRGPQYQTDTGPWTHAFSKFLCESWISDDDPFLVFTSGMDAASLGAAFQQAIMIITARHKHCCTLEDDGAKWDGSLLLPAIEVELAIYDWWKPPPIAKQAMRKQRTLATITNKGHSFGHVPGRRKTGDGNTSCGNSMLNALAHLWAIQKATQWPMKQIKQHMIMWVLGDDNLMFVSPELAQLHQQIEANVALLAIRPKCKLNHNPYMSEYCSGRFYPSSIGIIYGPKIGRQLIKHGWSRDEKNANLSWLKGVNLGVTQSWRPIPVLRALIKQELKFCNCVKAKPDNERHKNTIVLTQNADVTEETWQFVEQVYQIPRQQFEDIETTIKNVIDLPCLIRHPAIEEIIDLDVPGERGQVANQPEAYTARFGMGSIPPLMRLFDSLDRYIQNPQDLETLVTQIATTFKPILRLMSRRILAAHGRYPPDHELSTMITGCLVYLGLNVAIEEVVKRMHPWIGYLFPIFELFYKRYIFKRWEPMMLLPVVMHYIVNQFQLLPAMATHFIYNCIICLCASPQEPVRFSPNNSPPPVLTANLNLLQLPLTIMQKLQQLEKQCANERRRLALVPVTPKKKKKAPRRKAAPQYIAPPPPPPPRRRRRARAPPQAMLGPTRSFIEDNVSNPRPRTNPSIIPKQVIALSPCAHLYARSLIDPWSLVDGRGVDELPCVPTFPNQKTRKYTAYIKTMVTVGASGNGALALAPRRLANNYDTTNDTAAPLMYTSDATVAFGTAFPTVDSQSALSGGLTATNYNSDYDTSQAVQEAYICRLVCAGVRVRYAGTELNRGGNIHGYVDPSHTSVSTLTVDQISQRESYYRCQNVREWCTIVYSPLFMDQLELQPDFLYRDDGEVPDSSNLDSHFMGFVFTGMVAASTFEVEVVASFEIQGPAVRGQTRSTADTVGMQAVLNTVTPQTNVTLNQEKPHNVIRDIIDAGKEVTRIVTDPIGVVQEIAKAVL
jgi:hypothetical protein